LAGVKKSDCKRLIVIVELLKTIWHLKEHVLISHGYCATFGIEVPAPFYMQSLVAEIYPDPNYFVNPDGNSRLNALQSLINSAEETTPDSHFWAEYMTEMKTCWWNDTEGNVASLPDFFELDALFFKKMKQVWFEHFVSVTP
jgi:hypothetical protein